MAASIDGIKYSISYHWSVVFNSIKVTIASCRRIFHAESRPAVVDGDERKTRKGRIGRKQKGLKKHRL